MGTVAAIGEQVRVGGLSLVGVTVHAAEDPEEVRRAWQVLPERATLIILTPAAAEALGAVALDSVRPLVVVMPS
jgi:vacuolar-type H+-ATPase subunit F/Vma7